MQKLLVMLCGLLMFAGQAYAEHKLLITDVLDAKQMEAEASFLYSHSSYDFLNRSVPLSGTVTKNTSGSYYSFDVGLGHGLQVGASIPYLFSDSVKFDYDATPLSSQVNKRDGFGDLAIGAKYRIFDENTMPVTVVTGLDVKLNTASVNGAGTGTTNVSPLFAVSKKIGNGFRPYVAYWPTFRNRGAADTHALFAGLEKGMHKRVTLLAELVAFFNTASDQVRSNETFGGKLEAYLQVYGNFYVLPAVSASFSSSAERKDVNVRLDSSSSINGILSLYYLF